MELIELDERAPDRLMGAGCTLDAGEMKFRRGEWAELRDRSTGIRDVAGGVVIGLAADEPLDQVADRAARESDCCAFYTFLPPVEGKQRDLEATADPSCDVAAAFPRRLA